MPVGSRSRSMSMLCSHPEHRCHHQAETGLAFGHCRAYRAYVLSTEDPRRSRVQRRRRLDETSGRRWQIALSSRYANFSPWVCATSLLRLLDAVVLHRKKPGLHAGRTSRRQQSGFSSQVPVRMCKPRATRLLIIGRYSSAAQPQTVSRCCVSAGNGLVNRKAVASFSR